MNDILSLQKRKASQARRSSSTSSSSSVPVGNFDKEAIIPLVERSFSSDQLHSQCQHHLPSARDLAEAGPSSIHSDLEDEADVVEDFCFN